MNALHLLAVMASRCSAFNGMNHEQQEQCIECTAPAAHGSGEQGRSWLQHNMAIVL